VEQEPVRDPSSETDPSSERESSKTSSVNEHGDCGGVGREAWIGAEKLEHWKILCFSLVTSILSFGSLSKTIPRTSPSSSDMTGYKELG